MKKNYTLDMLGNIDIKIQKPCIIFLYGDLGVGKTTFAQNIIGPYVKNTNITSPTYVYYNKYNDIYHFDLYRLRDYDEFVSIGGEEILDNNEGLILIEWPELLEEYYKPDIRIFFEKTEKEYERSIEILYS